MTSTDSSELSPDTSSSSAQRSDVADALDAMLAIGLTNKQVDSLSSELVKSPTVQNEVQSRHAAHGLIRKFGQRPALPHMFSAISITDQKMLGCPIRMHSKQFVLGPEGLRVGECKYLNPPYGTGEGYGISTQYGEDGRPRFLLNIGSKLVGMQTGSADFILASQVDVTSAVRKLAVARWKRNSAQKPPEEDLEIDWLEFANEERPCSPGPRGAQQLRAADQRMEEITSSDTDLARFFRMVQGVKDLHRDYFVLKPLRSQSAYDIAWVSETLFGAEEAQERIVNQLRMMPTKVLDEFVQAIALGDAFSLGIPMRHTGKVERMYCVPMFQPPKLSGCVCFLVDWDFAGLQLQ